MAFEGNTQVAQARAATPEEMYVNGGLQRTIAAVDSLWLHQGDVIRAHAFDHQILVLVGDDYQIESIQFDNWFSLIWSFNATLPCSS